MFFEMITNGRLLTTFSWLSKLPLMIELNFRFFQYLYSHVKFHEDFPCATGMVFFRNDYNIVDFWQRFLIEISFLVNVSNSSRKQSGNHRRNQVTATNSEKTPIPRGNLTLTLQPSRLYSRTEKIHPNQAILFNSEKIHPSPLEMVELPTDLSLHSEKTQRNPAIALISRTGNLREITVWNTSISEIS